MSTIAFKDQGKNSGEITNNYPTFFLHGFVGWGQADGCNNYVPYWGGFHGNLIDEMNSRGYECYAPSLSGWQSAWDRACEFWAQLNGGTVDYGKVHSEKYGHARYGRTYDKPLLPDWHKTPEHEKINIIGHSFGGPTVLVIEHLLAEGSKAEREGTPEDELSDLFKGGKGDWLHTCTTMSGVLNGSNFASFLHNIGVIIIDDIVLTLVTMLGESKFNDFFDANMDQWGVMRDPKLVEKQHLRNPFAAWKKIKRYDANPNLDSIGHEMQVEAMYLMNQAMGMDKDAYHFARRACRSHPKEGTDRFKMNDDATIITKIAGFITCNWRGLNLDQVPIYNYNHYEDMWNDGFVTIKGMSGPQNKPNKDWEEGMEIEKGIWYNMPVENKDHMSWMGFGEEKNTYYNYIEGILDSFRRLP